ncbi:MAG: ABC transporter ATP-binding protein [Acidobacteriota bacterium]
MLEVRDIHFGYAEPLLRGVSFDLHQGELLAVVGPNGAGKSTLLKIVLGMLRASSGAVLLNGVSVEKMSRRKLAQMIGYVPQSVDVRFPLTAMEYVLQGRFAQGRILGFESDEDVEEARRAMDLTDSTEFASRLVSELSGGERQRVMLARAIASRPRLLALDEPVANLDIAHQIRMFDLARRLTAKGDMGAIVVTHELNLAAEFATRVLMLKRGEVRAIGKPVDVMDEKTINDVFDADVLIDKNPVTGAPRITLLAQRANISLSRS